jgi:hypothetical protein
MKITKELIDELLMAIYEDAEEPNKIWVTGDGEEEIAETIRKIKEMV